MLKQVHLVLDPLLPLFETKRVRGEPRAREERGDDTVRLHDKVGSRYGVFKS
jgi:hypothetical protein